ncbi:MAG: hypothetical protein J6Q94_03885 [Clostridia bacterium]|nr:hypothetical protein [Clostridia bacterium]
MKKKKNGSSVCFTRIICIIMAMMMAFSIFSVAVFADEEAEKAPTNSVINANDSKKREINVVFDNSGSMYIESRSKEEIDRWCYAKYAMEAFVATLNNNDILRVYPMNDIKTTGRDNPSTEPIVINGKDKTAGIEKIHNMFSSEKNGETPFTPVTKAADGFTGADSLKYLVVITDGNFQPDIPQTSETLPKEQVRADLEKIQNRGIEVLFLRLGDKNVLEANVAYREGVAEGDTNGIITAVNNVCNRIFQRIELDDDYIDDDEIELPISMSKLIVFAQGGNAKAGVIRLPGGTNINPVSSEHIQYSKKSSADGGKEATNLNGYVATYSIPGGVIAKGEYEIDAAGEIVVFYEPAIDVQYILKDPVTGEEVVPNEKNEIPSGDYVIDMKFVDSVTGEDVTEHELLKGKNANKLYAKLLDKEGKQIGENIENGKAITLAESDCSYIEVVGTYLDDYTITNNGKSNFGPLKIKKNPFKTSIDIENDYFCISDEKSWDSFVVSFTVDGKPVSKDEFRKIDLVKENVKIKDNDIDFDIIRDDETSTFKIRFKLGDKKATKKTYGSGTITVTPTYDVGGGEKIDDSARTSFSINRVSLLSKILTISGISLAAILLIIFILTRKVYPSKIWVVINGRTYNTKVAKGTVTIGAPGSMDNLRLDLKATCTVLHYLQKRYSIGVIGINPSASIKNFSFMGTSYSKSSNGVWPDHVKTLEQMETISGDDNDFSWRTDRGSSSGTIKFSNN